MKISKKRIGGLIFGLVAISGCVGREGTGLKKPLSEVNQFIKEALAPVPEPKNAPSSNSWAEPITGMEFVRVPAGCFQMGNPEYLNKEDIINEGPVHEVCLDEFYMGRYEVTVGEFRRFSEETGYLDEVTMLDVCYVVNGNGWVRTQRKNWLKHNFDQGESEPVVCLSWHEIRAFSDWLSSRGDGRVYRLPSEAEWEYAARAGTNTSHYWDDSGDDACDYANVHDLTSRRTNKFTWPEQQCTDGYAKTAPGGSFKANGFGLYDMLGNVWEWVQDWYGQDYYRQSILNNPSGPTSGQLRVARGGAWNNEAGYVRAAFRSRSLPDNRFDYIGFRLVFSPDREDNDGNREGSRTR